MIYTKSVLKDIVSDNFFPLLMRMRVRREEAFRGSLLISIYLNSIILRTNGTSRVTLNINAILTFLMIDVK